MANAGPGPADRNRKEIAASETELRKLEPDVDEGVIQDLVEAAYDELTPAKVHGYLPLLIVHQVRVVLRGRQKAA